jgi:arylsulfatase A
MEIGRLRFTRRDMLKMAGAGAVTFDAPISLRPDEKPSRKPNFVLVMIDDLGYGDLGCYGAKDIRTPHIDRMAKEGLKLTDFYVAAPLCTPSRAALMTGCYPARVGLAKGVLRPDSLRGLDKSETTIAELLKTVGYATACIGKWHLGFLPRFRPTNRGFDFYYGLYHNLDKFETVFFDDLGGMPIMRNDEIDERPADPATITEKYTDEAVRFIRDNKDGPFFLYLPHTMPHVPIGVSEKFAGKSDRGMYGDVVQCIDWSMGRILDTIREMDIAKDTIVVLFSDNGHSPKEAGAAGPLRGQKHTTYEGGMRSPCIFWGPGRVPAGKVSTELATSMDLLPTFRRLAHADPSLCRVIDGKDISSLVLGKPDAKSPHETFFYWNGRGILEAVRDRRWKFSSRNGKIELYDLQTDIAESTNLAEKRPEIVKRMTQLMDQHNEQMERTARPSGNIENAAPWFSS